MIFHVLNGDALTSRFLAAHFGGEMIVMRECLVEGDLKGETLSQFWQARASFIESTYHENEDAYFARVVGEFRKMMAASNRSEFNLWFGNDLFCQANMWFVLSLIHDLPISKQIFVVYPSFLPKEDIWKEFGVARVEDLVESFQSRVPFTDTDVKLGKELWKAYKSKDLKRLKELSQIDSVCFPYLQDVCQAHIDRFPATGGKGRPERVVEEIIQTKSGDFNAVFEEFWKREGIYGFGDAQLKHIYQKVLKSRT